MKISVFGMGYVGAVTSACLSRDGNHVIGVDVNPDKVEMINSGKPPIVESGLEELIGSAIDSGALRATSDAQAAVLETEVSMICVGTPSLSNGGLDLRYVRRVCEEIGQVIGEKSEFHIVIARSTMLPGSMAETVIPTLEKASGKVAGKDFGVCINPEFLREGSAIADYDNPPKTVIGASDRKTAERIAEIYAHLPGETFFTDLNSAEMVKYADNCWHATKVAFANEIGALCKPLNIDSHRVMEIFCKDTKLNLSPYYLKPGFAFGGSCLPKDCRALAYKGKKLDLNLPLMNAIIPSNQEQISRGIEIVEQTNKRNIGFLGFSFKAGTDDLRESPIVNMIEYFIGKGYTISLYDENVNMARLTGANKDYILNTIPHISRLMKDSAAQVIDSSEVLVVGTTAKEFSNVLDQVGEGTTVIDLVRVNAKQCSKDGYVGIAW